MNSVSSSRRQSASGPGTTSGPDQTAGALIDHHCGLLQLGPFDSREMLSVGQSGSLVIRLVRGEQRLILKITTDANRLARARTELRLISRATGGLADAMPRYVTGHADHDAVSLVTEEHSPLPPATKITDQEWSVLATSLGQLHSLSVPPWSDLPTAAAVDPRRVAAAAQLWREFGDGDDAVRAARLLLHVINTGRSTRSALLTHGDCHTENIVRDEYGSFRWIDWQEACLGDGCGDLVFLWQRAEFTGARPPREAMITAYSAARQLQPDADLRRALDAAELRSLFLGWPPFLPNGTAENRQRMVDRLPKLLDALGRQQDFPS
ncbi:MAG TPA: aminoglycoside phosphotransferase family protein [Microlunatus sp.]